MDKRPILNASDSLVGAGRTGVGLTTRPMLSRLVSANFASEADCGPGRRVARSAIGMRAGVVAGIGSLQCVATDRAGTGKVRPCRLLVSVSRAAVLDEKINLGYGDLGLTRSQWADVESNPVRAGLPASCSVAASSSSGQRDAGPRARKPRFRSAD
jgi:hypothetical protein